MMVPPADCVNSDRSFVCLYYNLLQFILQFLLEPDALRPYLALAALCILGSPAVAGEVSGLPPHLAPTTSPDYSFYLGNDFLASGTSDDFRTQQIIVTATLEDRWILLLDHSILTRTSPVNGLPARIDQMSLSLGYKLINERSPEGSQSLMMGVGARGVGNFEGSRIQNGVHALIESETSTLPYAQTRQTDATLWALGERHKILRKAAGTGWISGWDTGYWVRGGALATADGQFDGVAGLYAIASRPGFDLWLGARRDWREGYNADNVQIETAAAESKMAIAYGARLGSVVLEVVQRSDSEASYGQMSFVTSAATRKSPLERNLRGDVQLGLYLPHMMFQLAGRWHSRIFTDANSVWRESILVDLRAGRPQLGRDVTRFVDTAQLTAGLEFSRPISPSVPWLRFYSAASLGWRREQLVGEGDLAGVRSEAVDKAVLQADIGIEIDTTSIGSHWRHSLRFGLSGWLPTESVVVTDGGIPSELQRAGASVAIVWTFDYN